MSLSSGVSLWMSPVHGSVAPHPDVAARCRLDLRKLRSTKLQARGNDAGGLRREPSAPVGPPAPRYLACCLEPVLRPCAELAVHPEAALVARGRIDHTRDMPA